MQLTACWLVAAIMCVGAGRSVAQPPSWVVAEAEHGVFDPNYSTLFEEQEFASGGAYVEMHGSEQIECFPLHVQRTDAMILAIGYRAHQETQVVITLEVAPGEAPMEGEAVVLPVSVGWNELWVPIANMSPFTYHTFRLVADDVFDLDYVTLLEPLAEETYPCPARRGKYVADGSSVARMGPNSLLLGPRNVALVSQQEGREGQLLLIGSDLDWSDVGGVALKTFGAGTLGATAGSAVPVVGTAAGAIIAGGHTLVYQTATVLDEELHTKMGWLSDWSCVMAAGKCPASGGEGVSPCSLWVQFTFHQEANQDPFGDFAAIRVSDNDDQPDPPVKTARVDIGEIQVDHKVTPVCGGIGEILVEWGGTSWYQRMWDWMGATFRCDGC